MTTWFGSDLHFNHDRAIHKVNLQELKINVRK
jgi:hypothetical protein